VHPLSLSSSGPNSFTNADALTKPIEPKNSKSDRTPQVPNKIAVNRSNRETKNINHKNSGIQAHSQDDDSSENNNIMKIVNSTHKADTETVGINRDTGEQALKHVPPIKSETIKENSSKDPHSKSTSTNSNEDAKGLVNKIKSFFKF